jgi:hypothetical protein
MQMHLHLVLMRHREEFFDRFKCVCNYIVGDVVIFSIKEAHLTASFTNRRSDSLAVLDIF